MFFPLDSIYPDVIRSLMIAPLVAGVPIPLAWTNTFFKVLSEMNLAMPSMAETRVASVSRLGGEAFFSCAVKDATARVSPFLIPCGIVFTAVFFLGISVVHPGSVTVLPVEWNEMPSTSESSVVFSSSSSLKNCATSLLQIRE